MVLLNIHYSLVEYHLNILIGFQKTGPVGFDPTTSGFLQV